MTARIVQIIVGLAGLCALVLGLLIWIANIDLTDIHILFGLLVTLGLLAMSIIALVARGLRIWGMVGISYPIILLIFGVAHSNLLVGNLHWLIQTLHTLVGIGALVLTGFLAARSMQLQRSETKSTPGSQALH
jgi:ABC-type multidrug transport system permease subunit